jgi:hypothetical protein
MQASGCDYISMTLVVEFCLETVFGDSTVLVANGERFRKDGNMGKDGNIGKDVTTR